MKFGTGSNTERTQKYARVKVQNDIRTSKHIYINKQTSPIFNCVTPECIARSPSIVTMFYLSSCKHYNSSYDLLLQQTNTKSLSYLINGNFCNIKIYHSDNLNYQ